MYVKLLLLLLLLFVFVLLLGHHDKSLQYLFGSLNDMSLCFNSLHVANVVMTHVTKHVSYITEKTKFQIYHNNESCSFTDGGRFPRTLI